MLSSSNDIQKEGLAEITPAVIESAALEIIQNASDILEMYGINGGVTSLGLGLHPIRKKRKDEDGYALSFLQDQEYALSVRYDMKGGGD